MCIMCCMIGCDFQGDDVGGNEARAVVHPQAQGPSQGPSIMPPSSELCGDQSLFLHLHPTFIGDLAWALVQRPSFSGIIENTFETSDIAPQSTTTLAYWGFCGHYCGQSTLVGELGKSFVM